MKRAILRNFSFCTRNLLTTPLKFNTNSNPSLALLVSSTPSRLRFYSSESDSSSKPKTPQAQKKICSVEDVDAVSDEELKKKIEKYYEGDEDQIPNIFEAILKRKLAGISNDDSFMEALGRNVKKGDFDELHNSSSSSSSSSDSDSDDDKGR